MLPGELRCVFGMTLRAGLHPELSTIILYYYYYYYYYYTGCNLNRQTDATHWSILGV